jgi:hypothetical protein
MTLIEIRARVPMTSPQHVYEVRPRKDHRVVDLVSDALPFGSLWYTKPDDAIEYAKFRNRSYPNKHNFVVSSMGCLWDFRAIEPVTTLSAFEGIR